MTDWSDKTPFEKQIIRAMGKLAPYVVDEHYLEIVTEDVLRIVSLHSKHTEAQNHE